MSVVLLLVFGFLILSSCYGSPKFDLLKDVFNVHPKMDGTNIIDGPDDTKAVQLTLEVKPLDFMITGYLFSYLQYTILNSKDLTFFTWVYIPREFEKQKREKWPMFVLQDEIFNKNIFGIGFLSTDDDTSQSIEGGAAGSTGGLKTYVYIEQNGIDSPDKQRIDTRLLKPNTWISLEVRIFITGNNKRKRRKRRSNKEATASIYINCGKIVDHFKLKTGGFEARTLKGTAVLGMEVTERNTDDKIVVKNGHLFPGALSQTLLLDGPFAHDYFCHCHADYSLQSDTVLSLEQPKALFPLDIWIICCSPEIPPEPQPSEYNDEKFKLYQKMSSQTVKQFRTTCEYDDPITKNRTVRKDGESWKLDACKEVKCEIGKIILVEEYSCIHCNISGKIYKQKESWIAADDVCVNKTCDSAIESTNIKCNESLVCPVRRIPPKESGECCAKCLRDTCVDGRIFRNDCERRCGDEGEECKEKKHGCYCPLGELLDDNGNCIKAEKCQCKSGTRVYKPGQTAIRSKWCTCFCWQGIMNCNNC